MSRRDDDQRKGRADAEAQQLMQRIDPSKLSPEEYLERFGVSAYLKDVTTLMLENRPADPIEFLSEYFKSALQSVPPIVRCYRYITMTPRDRPAFQDNIVQAYAVISATRETGIGLTWNEFTKLLKMLCTKLPEPVSRIVISSRGKRSGEELVSFKEFCGAVNVCLALEDFAAHAKYIFQLCDSDNRGVVDRDLLIAVMKQAISGSSSEQWAVSPEKIIESLQNGGKGTTGSSLIYTDFLMLLTKLFVESAGNDK